MSVTQEKLTVVIDVSTIGSVLVEGRNRRKVFGQFVPGERFEAYRPVFEAALDLATQFDELFSRSEPCDDLLWERLMLAYGQINQLSPSFAEIAQGIEEFAISPNWRVEVTLKRPPTVI